MNDNLKAVLILIAIVVGGAVVVFLFDQIAAGVMRWAENRSSREQTAMDDAGIAITECRDHLPEEWTPTDEEIEQFFTDARNGGTQ